MGREIDKSIEKALENGAKNRRTFELVRNWCAYVTIKKMGGTGLVELQTGLPIGHHYLSCPHASANAVAAWDLADSAIDFYDRNCHDCKLRKPIGLPNISSLVTERDAKRKAAAAADDAARQRVEAELGARDVQRAHIRATLSDPAALSNLALIEDLDHGRGDDAAQRLAASAKLAPEAFPNPIVEHLFDLIKARIYRATGPAIEALAALAVDPKRLCNSALDAVSRHCAVDEATPIITRFAAEADPAMVLPALPALIDLAKPTREPFHDVSRPDNGPLLAVHGAFPKQTFEGIDRLLSQTHVASVSMAGRGVTALCKVDAQVGLRFARALAAKLIRKHLLLSDYSDYGSGLHDIRTPVIEAFRADPAGVDAILQSLLLGADANGVQEAFQIYGDLLRENRFDERAPVLGEVHKIAFQRLLWAATKDPSGPAGREAMQVFDHLPDFLLPLAIEQIDQLLGAAALVGEALEAHVKKGKEPSTDQLAAMEWTTARSQIHRLLEGLIDWVCRAACTDIANLRKVTAFYEGLPQSSELVRAELVAHFSILMDSAESMAVLMPALYSALLGAETRQRASGADAVAKLSPGMQQHLPDLVYEAIVVQLADPFIMVHQAAFRVVDAMKFPPAYDAQLGRLMRILILAYAQSREGDLFLLDCIRLFLRRFAPPERLNAALGESLVDILAKLSAYNVAKELGFLARKLRGAQNFCALLCRLLRDPEAVEYCDAELGRELLRLDAAVITAHATDLSEIAAALPRHRQHLVGAILEAFTRAGRWTEAAELADGQVGAIDDTKRSRARKLLVQMHAAACAFERALANNNLQNASESAATWRQRADDLKAEHAINQRRNTGFGISGPN